MKSLNVSVWIVLLGLVLLVNEGCFSSHRSGAFQPNHQPLLEGPHTALDALRFPARHKSLESLKADLKHPFHEVRANAVYELSKRKGDSLSSFIFPLLLDPSKDVVANARWYFHERYDLPVQAEPEWSRRWIEHFQINGMPEQPGFSEEGIPRLSESEWQSKLEITIEPITLYKEFGGSLQVKVGLFNRSSLPIRLRSSFDGVYFRYRFTESGHEFVDETGKAWQSLVGWSMRGSGLLEGIDAVTLSRTKPANDFFGEVTLAIGESTEFVFEMNTPQTQWVQGEKRRWDYCQWQIGWKAEGVLLDQVGHLAWAHLQTPTAVVTLFEHLHTADQLADKVQRATWFDESDFSSLYQTSQRLGELPESAANAFMDECLEQVSVTANDRWNIFLLQLVQDHLPVEIDVDGDPQRLHKAGAQLKAFWNREQESLQWDASTGRWDRP